MENRIITALLTIVIASGIIASSIAISNETYTWEKTFEVEKPKIDCRIKIGACRVVGCPVNIWVLLRVNACRNCCWHERENEHGENGENDCKCNGTDCWKCCCYINGTYSADLYWWNETSEDWQHVGYLQEETNITLTCWNHVEEYTFIPKWEGKYKVVVTFSVASEIYNFTNED